MAMPWLHRFTTDKSWRNSWVAHCWSTNGWSVATDAMSIIAVRDGGVQESLEATDADEKTRRRVEDALRVYLTEPIKPVFQTHLHHLWAWLGCWSCKVRRRGLISADRIRPVEVAGVVVNADRLVWCLPSQLEDFGVQVTLGTILKDASVLTLESDHWRVCLMGLDLNIKSNSSQVPPFPRFHTDQTYLRLWLERSDQSVRLILADYLEERLGDPYARVLRRREGRRR